MGRKSKSPKASPAAPTASASHTMDKNSQSVERKTKKEEVEDEVPLFSLEAQRQHTAQAARRPAPPASLPSSSSKPLAKEEEVVKTIKPKMSEKEAIAEARPKVSAVLKEVREHMETCVAQARATLDSLRRDERPTERGVSFLEVSGGPERKGKERKDIIDSLEKPHTVYVH